jgi:hypothetical protein
MGCPDGEAGVVFRRGEEGIRSASAGVIRRNWLSSHLFTSSAKASVSLPNNKCNSVNK